MNHLHVNRKERTAVSMAKVKKILQYAFYLVVIFWLLYQLHKSGHLGEGNRNNDIDYKLRNERIGKLLGRRGGLRRSSDIGFEMDLYGVDLVGAAERIKHVVKENEEGDNNGEGEDVGSNVEGNYEEEYLRNNTEEEESSDNALNRRSFGELLVKEGRIGEKMQENKTTTTSTGDGDKALVLVKRSDEDEKVGSRNKSQAVSLVSFGAVILKSVDNKWKVLRFNDENGFPKHESAPSRRSNIQVGSLVEENVSSSGNDSRELEACQKLCLQNILDKHRLSKSEQEAVHEEIKEMTEVESGKETMRELLQKERWLSK